MRYNMEHVWAANMNVLNAQFNPRNDTNMVAHKHFILRPKSDTQHTQFTAYTCNAILMILACVKTSNKHNMIMK